MKKITPCVKILFLMAAMAMTSCSNNDKTASQPDNQSDAQNVTSSINIRYIEGLQRSSITPDFQNG